MAQLVRECQDIQGIVRSGYGRLEEASFLLLRITDLSESQAWLAAVVEEPGAEKLSYRVTHAGHLSESHQERALQIAFSAPGLRRLGAPEELFQDGSINNFPREFRLGMAAEGPDPEGRSRRLGDIGENAPSNWEWGAPPETPDVLIMLYAEAGCLAAFQQMVMADLALGFEVFRVLGTAKAAEE